jgi:Putative beta-barrel porin 2
MKSIYLTIAFLSLLIVSRDVYGQEKKENPAPQTKTVWTIVVTDNLAPNKTTAPKNVALVKPEISFFVKTAKTKKSEITNPATEIKKTAPENLPKTETNLRAKKLSEWEKTWSIVARFSTSFDTNLEHDPVPVRAFGFVPSITAGYQFRSSNQRLRFIYSFAAPRYTIATDLNRFGNYFAAAYRYSVGRWSFETEGEVSLKGTNEDRETSNQYILTETIGYRFNKKTRLNVYGAYRIRRFPRADSDRNAVNPMLGLKFSRQLTKKIDGNVAYRYDENRAAGARQNYIRSTYKAGLDFQLTKNDSLNTEFSYRPRRYTSRFIKIGNTKVLRRDEKMSFDVVWKHNFSPRWGFEAGYQYEKQDSNDPEKLYRNHQVFFSIFYRWGNGNEITP